MIFECLYFFILNTLFFQEGYLNIFEKYTCEKKFQLYKRKIKLKKTIIVRRCKKMAHKINEECIACGACASICPEEAIIEGDELYKIDSAKCSDCGECVDTCPVGAISPAA